MVNVQEGPSLITGQRTSTLEDHCNYIFKYSPSKVHASRYTPNMIIVFRLAVILAFVCLVIRCWVSSDLCRFELETIATQKHVCTSNHNPRAYNCSTATTTARIRWLASDYDRSLFMHPRIKALLTSLDYERSSTTPWNFLCNVPTLTELLFIQFLKCWLLVILYSPSTTTTNHL